MKLYDIELTKLEVTFKIQYMSLNKIVIDKGNPFVSYYFCRFSKFYFYFY